MRETRALLIGCCLLAAAAGVRHRAQPQHDWLESLGEDEDEAEDDPEEAMRARAAAERVMVAEASGKGGAAPAGSATVARHNLGHPENPISILVTLKGETGNHQLILSHGYALKWMLQEDYNLSARVILRHQKKKKWLRARQSFLNCFPKFTHMDFTEGNTPEYDERSAQQDLWLGSAGSARLGELCENKTCLTGVLDFLVNEVLPNASRPALPRDANITLPFLTASSFPRHGYVKDRFLAPLKELFQFDEGNCCPEERARPEETVFHIRGLLKEMPVAGQWLGFEELSANRTASMLFAGYPAHHQIAVLGRFTDLNNEYAAAMRAAGYDARVVDTQTGMQSYCFLLSAKKELVGFFISSFVESAMYFGNASKSRVYSLDTKERRQYGDPYDIYNFTNPALRGRLSFEIYNSTPNS